MLTLTSNYLNTSAFYYFYDFNYRSHIEEKNALLAVINGFTAFFNFEVSNNKRRNRIVWD